MDEYAHRPAMPMPRFTMIETERLRVRRLHEADLLAFLAYRNDPEVARYQSWESVSAEQARGFIESLRDAEPSVPGEGFQFAVALRDSDELVGDIYLEIRASDPRQGEIGFTLAREHQGKGYASEAVCAVLDYCFGELGLHRVVGVCDVRNTASAALMERIGMRREGHFIRNAWFKGAYSDEYLYAVLGEEWAALRRVRRER
jgi:RimJ/RimL family protein N-acetyltransferase